MYFLWIIFGVHRTIVVREPQPIVEMFSLSPDSSGTPTTDRQEWSGRFTDVNFYRCGDGDGIDDTCPEHSIYGYMIDANSYQAGGRLERSASICGIPTASKLPGCLFAERALKSKNLKHFWKNVETDIRICIQGFRLQKGGHFSRPIKAWIERDSEQIKHYS